MSTIEKLLDALDDSREKLLMAIDPLPDEALLAKQAYGNWSVSDILNNIIAWEAELVTGMMRLEQKKRPDRLLQALQDPAKYDKKRFVETQGRNLDQVFLDLQQVRVQVEEWILEFSEADLDNPKRFRSLKGKALKDIIAACSYQRENKFLPYLQLFGQQWAVLAAEANNDALPLRTVDLTPQENNHDDTN
jgi:hypothetical protein